jgi:dienelactone hydrolase
VIVVAELSSVSPRVADFGRRAAGIGCSAVLPASHPNALAV